MPWARTWFSLLWEAGNDRCSFHTDFRVLTFFLFRNSLTFPAFLPTAYIVRREGYVLTRVCLSVHTWGGGYPGQVQTGYQTGGGGGGTPAISSQGGTPARCSWGEGTPPGSGGTPPWVPQSDLARGTPPQVLPPHQTWPGVPHLGYPPSQTWPGVPDLRYPPPNRPGRGYPCWGEPHLAPVRPGGGGGVPTLVNRWSTWYAAVGMPLAFTQEDFPVYIFPWLCSPNIPSDANKKKLNLLLDN